MNDATVWGATLPSRSMTIVPQFVLIVARHVAFCASDLLGGWANCCGLAGSAGGFVQFGAGRLDGLVAGGGVLTGEVTV